MQQVLTGIALFLVELSLPCFAQTVVASANVLCGTGRPWETTSGPVVGAIINQTNTNITDVEVELSIINAGRQGRS